jgi:hypothetical protein
MCTAQVNDFQGRNRHETKVSERERQKTSKASSFPHKMLNKALLVSLMSDARKTKFIETNSTKDFAGK